MSDVDRKQSQLEQTPAPAGDQSLSPGHGVGPSGAAGMWGAASSAFGAGYIQRKLARRLARKAAGEGAASAGAAVDEASGSAGAPVDAGILGKVESTTGADLGGVRVHTGPASQAAAASLDARAYAVGHDIHFGAGEYNPGSREGDRLIAHELVHTAQQGPSSGAPSMKLEVSEPGDASEVEADAIADSIVDGGGGGTRSVGPMGVTASRKMAIARKAFVTGSGTMTVDPYEPVDGEPGKDSDKRCGLKIDVKFHPDEDVKADKISFIQVMKCEKGDGAPLLFDNEKPRATTEKEGEAGWTVDRLKGKKSPNYGENNDGTAAGNTDFGYRKSKTDFHDAWMRDKVDLGREEGKTFACTATTFALDNTNSKYLGGVRWGYDVDKGGKVTSKELKLESQGDPSGIQKKALVKWNEQADSSDASKKNDPNQAKVAVPKDQVGDFEAPKGDTGVG